MEAGPVDLRLDLKAVREVDRDALMKATRAAAVKWNARVNPQAECGSCGAASSASFAYCPHCGAGKAA